MPSAPSRLPCAALSVRGLFLLGFLLVFWEAPIKPRGRGFVSVSLHGPGERREQRRVRQSLTVLRCCWWFTWSMLSKDRPRELPNTAHTRVKFLGGLGH